MHMLYRNSTLCNKFMNTSLFSRFWQRTAWQCTWTPSCTTRWRTPRQRWPTWTTTAALLASWPLPPSETCSGQKIWEISSQRGSLLLRRWRSVLKICSIFNFYKHFAWLFFLQCAGVNISVCWFYQQFLKLSVQGIQKFCDAWAMSMILNKHIKTFAVDNSFLCNMLTYFLRQKLILSYVS